MKIEQEQWKGWEVYLEDDEGNKLPEHEYHDGKKRSPYSQTVLLECHDDDQLFSIVVAPPPKAEAGFLMSVSIDGGEKEILGQRGEMNASLVYDDFMGSSADGLEVSRRLKFAPMQRSDDGPTMNIDQAGTIKVTLTLVEWGSEEELPVKSVSRKKRGGKCKSDTKPSLTNYVSGGPTTSRELEGYSEFTKDANVPPYTVVFRYATREGIDILSNQRTQEEKAEWYQRFPEDDTDGIETLWEGTLAEKLAFAEEIAQVLERELERLKSQTGKE